MPIVSGCGQPTVVSFGETEAEEGEEKKQGGCCPGPKTDPGTEVLNMLKADACNS
jgi:hypothetical protein